MKYPALRFTKYDFLELNFLPRRSVI